MNAWILSFGIIYFMSLFMNWLVQLGYYFYRIRKNPKAFAGQKTLLHYYTGYIGDGIIVPLINILIYYIMVRMGYKPTFQEIAWACVGGILLDLLTHYLQGRAQMTNWSMPRPFEWNGAGKWHMISFPIQMGYLLLFGMGMIQKIQSVKVMPVFFSILGILGLMAFFLILFCIDYPVKKAAGKMR